MSNVVYIVQCHYVRKKYVGCATRRLNLNTLGDLNNISNPNHHNISTVAKHFIDEHNSQVTTFQVYGIEKVCKPPRGVILNASSWIGRRFI